MISDIVNIDIDVGFRKVHDLTFMEAAFFVIISRLQSSEDGFCGAKNYYFRDILGIKDGWILSTLVKLKKKGLLWYHLYNTKNGRRRHIVTPGSIQTYKKYLKLHKSWRLLRKFKEEFSDFYPSNNLVNDINTKYLNNNKNKVICKINNEK